MSDPAAFLRAIIAHPDEDAPRLVYADWLDERGDPYGEFIRVQCELAAWEFVPCECTYSHHNRSRTCDRCRPVEPLRARERELLAANWQDWSGPLRHPWRCVNLDPAPTVLGSFEFRRGFVAAVTLSAADWLGGPCGRCQGGAFDPEQEPNRWGNDLCRICHGTGRLPGHAAALRAATPLRTVRLTDFRASQCTERRVENRRRLCRLIGRDRWHEIVYVNSTPATYAAVLAAEWPGLTFELPATPNA